MEIVYRKLSELKANPKNPRTADPEQIEKLAASIKANPKFFEARPILLSDRTGQLVIIGGERRSEAAKLLSMVKVPEYTYDCHTYKGKARGRTKADFFRDELEALKPREKGLFDDLV